MKSYPEYKQLNLPAIAEEILKFWEADQTFEKSISEREGKTPWVFYEGPPSANGMPGIHHVMARTIKDIFCRYKTMQGFQVKRKAGWDTHGLPIELGVEKSLGITKEDIGKKITVEQYNLECRKDVMKYTDKWELVTKAMGYWVDMQSPYITYENKYIETVWWLLKRLHEKNLLYKGYTIQPYSPAAGTGLSSHELNQPGCYKDIKDNSLVAQFDVTKESEAQLKSAFKINEFPGGSHASVLAWTTTPWTLPSNTALAVGKEIDYVLVQSYNAYVFNPIVVVLAKDLVSRYFNEKAKDLSLSDYREGDKLIPYKILGECKGKDLLGIRYHQLLPYALPYEKAEEAFRIIAGDFVTTTDGTGIVHIAPTFGADDMKAAKDAGIPPMLVMNEFGKAVPLVDLSGKFRLEVSDAVFGLAGEYVKENYLSDEEKINGLAQQKEKLKSIIPNLDKYLNVDERIGLKLKIEGRAFKIEKYQHNYPHCWRTDKPVLYYPLDSWFIRTTAVKDRMIELNKTINWKPEATGTGRFGNWLENLNDWNLSRSRFWGIPIPIWTSEDGSEQLVIGSAEELKKEIDNSVAKGFMQENPLAKFVPGDMSETNYTTFDLHKPYADSIVLERNGKKLQRETDLIDVWFDSGAMPYAQLHYPFENKDLIDEKKYFPADFIAEGVDQTRGWFFTLHAIGTMIFDSVAFKNVVSNGLVLDKHGQKMSKRLGNAVDPFQTLPFYSPDATRWYLISNAAPWENLKFNAEGITEVQRKLFGTIYNTYSFFALYANVDGYVCKEKSTVPVSKRAELDRWILSKLNSLVKEVSTCYDEFEPHRAARAIEEFVDEHLSNWYVRLSRRRFWKGEMSNDKEAAYDTLFECLVKLSQMISPIAPFFGEWMYRNLLPGTSSVHISNFCKVNDEQIDLLLEKRMGLAQKISSMVLSIRKKENIRVRQPLQRIQIPVIDKDQHDAIESVTDLILAEVNVKNLEFVDESNNSVVKTLKLNFKTLGKKCGKHMKSVQAFSVSNADAIIKGIEREGKFLLNLEGDVIELLEEDTEIIPVDIPGWKVANQGNVTVALDININEELKQEGIARELVNRIQNIRKENGLEVTDKIIIKLKSNNVIDPAVKNNLDYICNETLCRNLNFVDSMNESDGILIEVDENTTTYIAVEKIN